MEFSLDQLVYLCLCVHVALTMTVAVDEEDSIDSSYSSTSEDVSFSSSSFSTYEEFSYYSLDEVADKDWIDTTGGTFEGFPPARHNSNGFHKLDSNKDGYVSKLEYELRNPGVDKEIVRTLFSSLDTDGDDMLTEDEMVNRTDFWDTTQDCEVFAMQQCDGRLTYTVELSDGTTEQEAMCQGLQAYFDCLASESTFCDFTSDFLQAVYTFAQSYKTTELCKDLVTKGLARFGESDYSSRRRRSADAETIPPTGGAKLECVTPQLSACTTLFSRSLRETDDFCTTLSQYRHCVSHAAKNCNDETLFHLKESVRVLTHMHKKFQVCNFQ